MMRAPLFFDRIARVYRWGEYLSFGKALERCRFCFLAEVSTASKILTLGEGDGRFLAALLKKNSQAMADAVDVSEVMLSLLQGRVQAAGAEKRLRTHLADVRDFEPSDSGYDLVVTHFFLDCLTENEIAQLMKRLRPHLANHSRWLVSDFAIPAQGVRKIFGTAVVSALYLGFWLLTNLQIRRLPELSNVWRASSFESKRRQEFLGGLIYSEIRELQPPAAAEKRR
jgi:cyclopropane fatty-acyl-phospholipid synthase-like methyltransferase